MHISTFSRVLNPLAISTWNIAYAGVFVSSVLAFKRKFELGERARAPTADRFDKT